MTEKKKRGRPPKIRKIDPVTPEVAAEIYNEEHPEQHTSVYEVKKSKKEIHIVKGVSSGPLGTIVEYEDRDIKLQDNNGNDLTPKLKLPSNWDTMGKIDRLKFLTANRKK